MGRKQGVEPDLDLDLDLDPDLDWTGLLSPEGLLSAGALCCRRMFSCLPSRAGAVEGVDNGTTREPLSFIQGGCIITEVAHSLSHMI